MIQSLPRNENVKMQKKVQGKGVGVMKCMKVQEVTRLPTYTLGKEENEILSLT